LFFKFKVHIVNTQDKRHKKIMVLASFNCAFLYHDNCKINGMQTLSVFVKKMHSNIYRNLVKLSHKLQTSNNIWT